MNINPKIMIVDDEPVNIDVLYGVLKNEYRIIGVTSGSEALEILENDDKPEIILLDICMPEIDGYEVCRRIKESPALKDIPVIFLSAADNDEDEICGFSIGAVDFIAKPIRPSIVKARIQTQLKLRHKHLELETLTKELQEVIKIFENKITIPSQIKNHKTSAEQPREEKFDITKVLLDDHIMDMLELENIIDAKINLMSLKEEIDDKNFFTAKESLARYGEILSLYPDFIRVGNGLKNFADKLSMQEGLPQTTLELVLASMEVMVFTLLRWREQLFGGELKNIHAYDDSLLADFETILLLLEPENMVFDTETDDICFF